MLGVRWAEDLSLAPVGQPEDREPAVLVLEREPKDISVEPYHLLVMVGTRAGPTPNP